MRSLDQKQKQVKETRKTPSFLLPSYHDPVGNSTVVAVTERLPEEPSPRCNRARFLSGAHRESTRKIGEVLWPCLKDGPAVVNLSQLAREIGYSRPTIYRAIVFFMRFGKLLPIEEYNTGNAHPGRPAMYKLNPAYLEQDSRNGKADTKRISSKRVTPSYKYLKKRLKEKSLKTEAVNTVDRLTGCLRSVNDNDCPSSAPPRENRDKRRLCAVARELASVPLANAVCDEIWHRSDTTYGTWKEVLRALWNRADLPQELADNAQELAWRVRVAIKRLADGEECETFTELLADGYQPEREGQLKRELQRNRQREKGRKALWQWYKTEVEQTDRCPYCGEQTTPEAICDANVHSCSGWFFRLREKLAEERWWLANELFALRELAAAKAMRDKENADPVPGGLISELACAVFKTVTLD